MGIYSAEVLLKKTVKKFFDRVLGAPLRQLLRYGFSHWIFLMLYKVEKVGVEEAESCTEGAIVLARHVCFLDGPFLMSFAWPLARIRFIVWHKEFTQWFAWPFMKLFGAISAGSPKELPDEERARRKTNTLEIMDKVLKANHALGIFPEGGIGDGITAKITPHLAGTYDAIKKNPDKPVLMVTMEGLEYSRLGKRFPKCSFWRRLPVRLVVKRFDRVSLEGGPAGLNKRIEDYYNKGTALLIERERPKLCAGTSVENQ